jgi:bifunctional non-homologous end joining protein LigD
MLATSSSGRAPRLVSDYDGWAFEEKIDGVRALVIFNSNTGVVTIGNRSGNDITIAFPEVVQAIGGKSPTLILDGEIVLRDGTFGDLNGRAKVLTAAKAADKAQAMPAKFVAFDVLNYGNQDMLQAPYVERRRLLFALGERWANDPAFEVVRQSFDGPAFFDQIKAEGGEGMIAKRVTSIYRPGQRSPDWVKFKTTSTVTCIAVSYEPGTGARAHFGAMHLAMVGGDKPIYVGKVGTGLSNEAIAACKLALDAGQFLPVEVETLGVTKDNKLRFPVFKGIRSDLTVHDAHITQLDTLALQ